MSPSQLFFMHWVCTAATYLNLLVQHMQCLRAILRHQPNDRAHRQIWCLKAVFCTEWQCLYCTWSSACTTCLGNFRKFLILRSIELKVKLPIQSLVSIAYFHLYILTILCISLAGKYWCLHLQCCLSGNKESTFQIWYDDEMPILLSMHVLPEGMPGSW